MPTYGHAIGIAAAERLEVHQVSCQGCGLVAYAAAANMLKTNAVGFDTLLEEPQLPPQLSCPECGRELQVERSYVGFWPDEPELPALFWQAEVGEDGQLGDPDWFLLSAPQPAPDSLAAIGEALLDEAQREPLEDASEDELLERWGRPLSMRSAWQFLFSKVSGGGFAEIDACQGMTLVALEVPDEVAGEQELKDWIASQLSRLKRMPEPGGGWAFRLSEGLLEPAGFTEWGGPWADKIGREIAAFAFVDRGVVLERLDEAIERAKIERCEPPELLPQAEELEENGGLPAMEGVVGEQRKDKLWLSDRGVRFSIAPGEVGFYATVRGLTLAEAAQQRVTAEVMLARACRETANNVQAVLDAKWRGKASITLVTPSRADLKTEGQMIGVANLSSLLEKFDYDTAHPELIRRIVHMIEQMEQAGAGEPISLCSCGQFVFLHHLRPLDFKCGADPRFSRVVEDANGIPFNLYPTVDCPHSVAYLMPELVKQMEEAGEQIEHRLQRGPETAQFRFGAETLKDAFGAPIGALVRGHNIGTVLAHPQLLARLYVHLRKRLPFAETDPLWAFALTTDVALVTLQTDTAVERGETAIAELKMRLTSLPGQVLGFTAHPLPRKIKPRGLIELDWQRERVGV